MFIAWALATGLARKAIEVLAPPIQTVIETEDAEEAPAAAAAAADRSSGRRWRSRRTDTVVEIPVAVATTAITNTTTQHVAAPPAPRPAVHKNVSTDAGQGHFPNSEDFYPPASRASKRGGLAQVHVCVGPNGKFTGDPTIEKSSGIPELDEARSSLPRQARATISRGRKTVSRSDSCLSFQRISFKLRN